MYLWPDATDQQIRAKTKTISSVPQNLEELPIWNYYGPIGIFINNKIIALIMLLIKSDKKGGLGSSQLIPVAMFSDPFRGGKNKLILCDRFDFQNNPMTRRPASKKICDQIGPEFDPMFGFEQEYSLLDGYTG